MGEEMKKEKTVILFWAGLVICTLAAIALRIYQVTAIPVGMSTAEASLGYDAWCLANYGTDALSNKLPVYLTGLGEGQGTLYAYIAALIMKLMGGKFSLLALRLPAVIVSVLGFIAGLYVIFECYGKRCAVFGGFLMAIFPIFILQGRSAADVNILISMMTICIALTMLATEFEILPLFILAGVFWGLSFYTCSQCYLPNTVLLIILFVVLLREDFAKSHIFGMYIPILLLGIPLILFVVVNQFHLSTLNLGFFTVPRIMDYKGGELYFNIKENLENAKNVLKVVLTTDGQFPCDVMYYVSALLIAIGFIGHVVQTVVEIAKKDINWRHSFGIIFIVYFVVGCFVRPEALTVARMSGIYFAAFFMVITAIRLLFLGIEKISSKIAIAFIVVLALGYGRYAFDFAMEYFRPEEGSKFVSADVLGTYEDILTEQDLKDKPIYIDWSEDDYLFFLLSAGVSPEGFHVPEKLGDTYKNVTFGLPKKVKSDAVYIVKKKNTGYLNGLQSVGYTPMDENEFYACIRS